jgi:hypothetical protein
MNSLAYRLFAVIAAISAYYEGGTPLKLVFNT